MDYIEDRDNTAEKRERERVRELWMIIYLDIYFLIFKTERKVLL